MELSLLEAKTGSTNNNGQTTAGLAESVETRWIITEGDKKIHCIDDEGRLLTEVLVGVDIRPVTGNRNQYPRIEIWGESRYHYRNPVSVELRLSPHNFTTNGLYRFTLPTPLNIKEDKKNYRLGVYQPPDDRSVVRFYKVTGTGQIGRVANLESDDVDKNSDDGQIVLQNSSILIYPITLGSRCSYPPIKSSFNTNSLSVTNVIPVNDTRAFPDIQFTCNGIITNWIIGITQNQDTSKHYPNIYLKRSSELIHALTVDASVATSSNGNVYLFTSDIEVQYGDILVINVTTNSNPMYYQQYNGPLNYQLDSSNGLVPLEHNDYPLISVVVGPTSSTTIKLSSTTTIPNTVASSTTSSTTINTPPPIVTRISTTTLFSISTSSSRFTVTESMKYTETTTSSGTAASVISGPVVSTPNQSTGSNTLILVGSIGAVFILLVVTILVILIVSVLVCRRRGSSNPLNTDTDVHHQTIEVNVADIDSKCIVSNISSNPAYGIIGGKNSKNLKQ
uniref:Uncharacterized protein n=1 Tax=Amphimedon queenslandica TaxID=400682 RepID=A0A1X7UCV3_AMPQE